MARNGKKNSLVWGVILIVFGLIFILDNADIDAWHYVGELWPLIFILWGGWKLMQGLKAKKEERSDSASPSPQKTDQDLK